MLAANISSQVNVLVETIGTKSWSKRLGIASDHTQRYKAEAGNLVLVDDSLGQLDCTSPDTLADFISWGAENYPANRYILIFWDHGAGPVYGFGYDEHQSEDSVLTIDEIQTAIRQSGIYFDIIGMDSCIMSSLELCCAMYNYCDYMILSEDFESGYGWSYTGWLNALSENTSISSEELGKIIVDDMIADNEENGEGSSTLALIDESYMKVLYTAWADFAYTNEPALLGENYSMHLGALGALRRLDRQGSRRAVRTGETQRCDGADLALRRAVRAADGRAELHERLREVAAVPGGVARAQRCGERGLVRGGVDGRRIVEHARAHAQHIAVHGGGRPLKADRGDRPGRVRADAR